MPARRVERAATVLLLGVVCAAVLTTMMQARPGPDDMLHSLADETLLYPLALGVHDPDLFPRDAWLSKAETIFSPLYGRLVAPLVAASDQPVALSWALSFGSVALFLVGAVMLGRLLTGRWAGGLILAGLWLIPGARSFGVGPGQALPRDFLFALFPWVVMAFVSCFRRSPVVWGILGLVLGLAANLHPLTALHFGLLAGLGLLFAEGPSRRGIRRGLGLTAGFLIGTMPYVVRFLSMPRVGAPSAEGMSARVPGMISEHPSVALGTWGPVAALGFVLLVLGMRGVQRRRPVLVLLLAAAGLGVCGAFAGALNPQLGQLQLGRLARAAGFLLLLATAALLLSALRTRRPILIAASVLVLLLLTFLPAERAFLRKGGRRVFGRPESWILGHSEISGRPAADRRDYRALAAWCRENTPVDALVLVPPGDFSHFRLYARRSVVVTRKDGGYACSFLGEEGMRWLESYREVVGLYTRSDAEEILEYCRKHDVDLVLSDEARGTVDLPVAHRVGSFALHRVVEE